MLEMPTVSPELGQASYQFGGVTHEQANRAWAKFQAQINTHTTGLNTASKTTNLISAFGYFVAFVTAIISALTIVKEPEE